MQDVRKTVLASLPACETMVTEIVARSRDVNHEVRTGWSCTAVSLCLDLSCQLCWSRVLTSQLSVACHLWTDLEHHDGSTCGKQEALHSLLWHNVHGAAKLLVELLARSCKFL